MHFSLVSSSLFCVLLVWDCLLSLFFALFYFFSIDLYLSQDKEPM